MTDQPSRPIEAEGQRRRSNDDASDATNARIPWPTARFDIPPRPRRDKAPIEWDRTPVKVRGDGLSELWWRGRQWAVTAYGIERLDGTYAIEVDRITEHLPGFSLLEHMARKRTVDADDFATAWLVALTLHGRAAAPVREAIRRSDPPRVGAGLGDAPDSA